MVSTEKTNRKALSRARLISRQEQFGLLLPRRSASALSYRAASTLLFFYFKTRDIIICTTTSHLRIISKKHLPHNTIKMPDINNFPNELMVETFLHLDLKNLTRCMRVSKSFKTITEHSAFDKIFFRTKAIKPGDSIDLDKLQINPALDQLHYTCRSKIKEVTFLFCDQKPDDKTDYRELALIDSTAAKQNATEPALTCIVLSPYGCPDLEFEVESDQGVTVQDIMEGLCDYYQPGVPYDACHYFFEGFHKSKKSSKDELVLEAWWGS